MWFVKNFVRARSNPPRPPFFEGGFAAGGEVVLIGAIHDKATVSALRFHSALYAHGHQVGGTNPSLVEATGAGSGVLAHGNRYNRWVAGPGARYFKGNPPLAKGGRGDLPRTIRRVTAAPNPPYEAGDRAHALGERHGAMFTWERVLGEYEDLLSSGARFKVQGTS